MTDDLLTIQGELLYIRSGVHDWCPDLVEMLYCDSGLQKYFAYGSEIPLQAATLEPGLTPATLTAPPTVRPATVPFPGNSPPNENQPDRLRDREIRSSHSVERPESTARPVEASSGQCVVPLCSVTRALDCLDNFTGNSSSCG